MDAITVLKADHRALQELCKEVENTSNRAVKAREELFKKIKHEATIHEKAEEKFFYSLLKSSKENKPNTLEHTEEVTIMSRLLKEMDKFSANSEEWMAKFTVLKEITDHHIEEEENEFFPKATKILSKKELEESGNKIIEYKENNPLKA